jgi:monoamine oxidase
MLRSPYSRLAARAITRGLGLDRRDFLRLSVPGAVGLLLPSCAWTPRRRGEKRVLVAGAGLAGLAAAYELRHLGYDVMVFEARDRVGGRVWSVRDLVTGKVVEAGGEYIGANHPVWLSYAQRFGLGMCLVDVGDEWCPTILDGKRLSAAEEEELCEAMGDGLWKLSDLARPVDEDRPWLSPDAARLDNTSTAAWIQRVDTSELGKRTIRAMLEAENGVAVAQQSLLGNLTQVKGGGLEKFWTDTEKFRCRGGNQELARHLAEEVGPARVLLRTPVRAIDLTGNRVKVRTANGTEYIGDELIFAVPPSVWPSIDVQPHLPAQIIPQMGTIVKYLAVMRRPFWEGKVAATAFTDGEISLVWESTKGQGTGAAVLCAYSGGPAAHAVRRYTKEERDPAYAKLLEVLLPGYAEDFVSARFIDWPADRWSLASYSFPAPGEVTTVGPLLASKYRQLHFTGEHACYKFVGYMEGALQSGVRVARRIAEADGLIASEQIGRAGPVLTRQRQPRRRTKPLGQ